MLGGVTVTVKAAHVRLCHSRMLFVRAYPRETQEMVFDAHDRAFALCRPLPFEYQPLGPIWQESQNVFQATRTECSVRARSG